MNAMVFTNFLALFFPMTWSVNPGCDYDQLAVPGETYYVYNPGYPNSYPGGVTCRWAATTENPNDQIALDCTEVQIPPSTNCQNDKLAVSITGDKLLSDAHYYCGKGAFRVVSRGNKLSVGFLSQRSTSGGSFLCSLQVVQPITPQPESCNCGWSNTKRIVGGVNTGVNEYPMMAALVDAMIREIYCGATIISTKHAITSAHCLSPKQPKDVGFLIGDHDISQGSDTGAAQLLRVEKFIVHPDFNPATYSHDIGIIKTMTDIPFTLEIGPVCLPFHYQNSNFDGITVKALGWGTTEFAGPKADILQKVDLDIVTQQECQKSFPNVDKTQICTFRPGKDACQADSGGPLLWQDSYFTRIQLLGIISNGIGCAGNTPGINARVVSYLPWIVTSTPEVSYCIKN